MPPSRSWSWRRWSYRCGSRRGLGHASRACGRRAARHRLTGTRMAAVQLLHDPSRTRRKSPTLSRRARAWAGASGSPRLPTCKRRTSSAPVSATWDAATAPGRSRWRRPTPARSSSASITTKAQSITLARQLRMPGWTEASALKSPPPSSSRGAARGQPQPRPGSTLVCTPASRSQEVGLALGAQAGERRLREVVTAGGFTRFRRAAETPLNLVFEARP